MQFVVQSTAYKGVLFALFVFLVSQREEGSYAASDNRRVTSMHYRSNPSPMHYD